MKKTILIILILFSIQAFSQNNTKLSNLDLTGQFAVYEDTVYSTKGTFYFKDIVETCEEIQSSNLLRNEKDLLFLYLIDWWLYSNNDPEPDLIHTINTQKFVNNSELYLQTVNAIKIIVYDIPTGIISENTSRDEFNKAAKIIALPDDKKDNYYSDKYSNR